MSWPVLTMNSWCEVEAASWSTWCISTSKWNVWQQVRLSAYDKCPKSNFGSIFNLFGSIYIFGSAWIFWREIMAGSAWRQRQLTPLNQSWTQTTDVHLEIFMVSKFLGVFLFSTANSRKWKCLIYATAGYCTADVRWTMVWIREQAWSANIPNQYSYHDIVLDT